MPILVLLFNLLSRLILCTTLALALPAEVIDFLWVYLVVLSVQWLSVLVLGFFTFGLNNILLMLSLMVWLLVLPVGRLVIGTRAVSPSLWMRMPEYFISFLVFVEFLGLVHHILMTACRIFIHMQATGCCFGLEERNHRIQRWVRLAHVYFFNHQLHTLQAYIVLLATLMTSLFIAALDKVCCRIHTWWLLNYELARTDNREQYLQNKPTLLEQESQRHGHQSETSSFMGGETSEEAADSSSSEAASQSRLLPQGREGTVRVSENDRPWTSSPWPPWTVSVWPPIGVSTNMA